MTSSDDTIEYDKPITIIGAGVIGLSTATVLQETFPTSKITIVAAEIPTTTNPSADYASLWAGAHYRPIPRTTRQLESEFEVGLRTAERMKRIAKDNPEAGVAIVPGVEYLENPTPDMFKFKTGDFYAGPDDNFRVFEKNELPAGVKWGCEYEAYCVNIKIYTRWLMDNFQKHGGKIIQQRLNRLEDIFELSANQSSIVVNCSGRNFDTDPKMKIIRGQTVLVKQQYNKTVTRQNADGSWSFLVPRPRGGGTIVGGTKEIGDTETKPRPESRLQLLEACIKNFPDFVDSLDKFEVIQDNVGRRPWREGGVRVETEFLPSGKIVVHGYGMGGRGYELSWGTALEIVEQVKQVVGRPHKL